MTIDPVLYARYVCTNETLEDRLKGFRPLLCEETTKRYTKPRLFYSVFDQPSDMHGYHAAVRYLRERGSDEQLGIDIQNSDYFNLNWNRYEETLNKVYLEMIWNSPIDSLYMYIIAKPLKYFKEAILYLKYFIMSFLKSDNMIGIFGFLCIVILFYYYLILGFRNWIINQKNDHHAGDDLSAYYFLIIYISSLVPSILLYSQPHTIADSVTILLTLCLFLPVIFIRWVKNRRVKNTEIYV
jgi:hypothetical protein